MSLAATAIAAFGLIMSPTPVVVTRSSDITMQFGKKAPKPEPMESTVSRVLIRHSGTQTLTWYVSISSLMPSLFWLLQGGWFLGDWLSGPAEKFLDGRRELLAPREFDACTFPCLHKFCTCLIKPHK